MEWVVLNPLYEQGGFYWLYLVRGPHKFARPAMRDVACIAIKIVGRRVVKN